MNDIGQAFKSLLRTALGIGMVVGVLILIFIAWWIAVIAVGGLLAYAGVRRFLHGRKAGLPREDAPAVIEGEYRVEPESLPDRRSPP